ncbi:hypothetical protein D3C81_2232990 [compost metagenome]
MREQRSGDDENHQQYQHDVDHGRDVDIRHRTGLLLVVESAECHIVSRLAYLPTRAPVVR